jgi:hypothetical protein
MQQAVIRSGQRLDAAEIDEHILPSATLTAAERLGIYQRGYHARLLQCLESQFKALRHALGEGLFRDFGVEYLRAYPSHSPTLSDLGARLSQWLSENRPDLNTAEKEPWIDFMIDLARYEWAVYGFFDKPGHEGRPLATAQTADVDLVVQATLELHQFTFPVAAYYHAVAAGEAAPPIPGLEDSYLVIVRKHYLIGILRLTEPQHHFLGLLAQGQSVPDALGALAEAHRLPVSRVAEAWMRWKKHWCESGLFGLRRDSTLSSLANSV